MSAARRRLVALAGLAIIAGCGRQLTSVLRPNQSPEVVVTATKESASEIQVRWAGSDRDGRIDHYLVAENPMSMDQVDGSWRFTSELGMRLPSPVVDESEIRGTSREPRTVAVRAIDDRGAMSDPAWVSAFGGNIAPTVKIVWPSISVFDRTTLPPNLRVSWIGSDPDGQATTRPVKYKFMLFDEASEFRIADAIANPDSLRRFYAPGFAGWDSTGADSLSVLYRNLTKQRYLFVVVAFDEVGDYSPVFSLLSNMRFFRVAYPKTVGPIVTLYNESFGFSPLLGGFVNDPTQYGRLETAPDRTVEIHWHAEDRFGADIVGTRWVLDPVDLNDETTRSSPTDTRHWSARGPETSVTLGPFHPAVKSESHLLFVEALDSWGNRGLAAVRITVLKSAPFDEDLLIVDDTRLTPDFAPISGGCVNPPLGAWPTAAELDTFLYARGGVPWQCYPAGTSSTPGLFTGYRFDTLGTRNGKADQTVPLSTLVNYRHVIWITDFASAQKNGMGSDPVSPVTALRYMAGAARFNSLVAYVQSGGHLWLAGAGTAYAAQRPWDDRSNNSPPGRTVFNSAIPRELGAGRLMYDLTAWRSAIGVQKEALSVHRVGGRLEGSPELATLPERLERRSIAPADPLPPLRTASDFYVTAVDVAYLFQENRIIEGGMSTLDTLYEGTGPGMPTDFANPNYHDVVMTQYHGAHAPVIFTGFNFWDFKRAQCQQLVDHVLQQMWGLTPSAPARMSVRIDGDAGRTTYLPRTSTWQCIRTAVRR